MNQRVMANVADRPWPVPSRPWVMAMRWHDLLFLHWPIDAAILRPLIPPSLEIDTYEGQAWIGVVQFHMTSIRPRFVPPLPGLSAFPEINVRTYVTSGDKPGVWFFSLDAEHRLAVRLARWSYNLPYYFARISVRRDGDRIVYQSARRTLRDRSTLRLPSEDVPMLARFLDTTKRQLMDSLLVDEALFAAVYGPTGQPYRAAEGSIDRWLTDRFCLYAADRQGQIFRAEVHHAPWPLQPADADIRANTMTEPLGIQFPQVMPLMHFARRLDVVAWWPERIQG
jgi:uncharacterized protein YqjF (DUF2071 family)